MAVETKIKEVKNDDSFPALYCTEDRSSVVLVHREIGKNLEGVVMHPYKSFGQYSTTWSKEKYKRMGIGSELTIKYIQE